MTAINKPTREALEETHPTDTLISDFWPPQLRGNTSLVFRCLSLWSWVVASSAKECSYHAESSRADQRPMQQGIKISSNHWELPGGPVARTWHFHCRGLGSIPGQGTKTLLPAWYGQKKFFFKDFFKSSWRYFEDILPIITIFTSSVTKQLFEQRIIVPLPVGKFRLWCCPQSQWGTGTQVVTDKLPTEKGGTFQKSV